MAKDDNPARTGEASARGRGRGRPAKFTTGELVAVARRLGPDAIGLEAVAEELGVGRTSLYWHVRNRDELGRLVLNAVIAEELEEDWRWLPERDAPWEQWLTSYATALRRTLRGAGPWLRFGSTESFFTKSALRFGDRVLEALHHAGFRTPDATRAFGLVTMLARASVLDEMVVPASTPRAALAKRLRPSDPDGFPWLAKAQQLNEDDDDDERFAFYLQCALAGIAACVPLAARPR